MITHKENTFSGLWPMTKENTWYGYQVTNYSFEWFKTKKTAIKHIPNKKGWILRGTLIKDKMFINKQYAKMSGW